MLACFTCTKAFKKPGYFDAVGYSQVIEEFHVWA